MDFGSELRALRKRHNLRQADLAARLRGGFARSTVANVEAGREAPSERMWKALSDAFPDDVARLEPSYLEARRLHSRGRHDPLLERDHHDHQPGSDDAPLGGSLVIERRDITFVFRQSTSPEEIIEVFEVRSRQEGLACFAVKMRATNQEGFRLEPEVLWGGRLIDTEHVDRQGYTFVLREIEFGRPLGLGERHCFAIRSWVAHDSDPDMGVDVTPSQPTCLLGLHLAFLARKPAVVWAYGPVPDEAVFPNAPDDPAAMAPDIHGDGHYSATFSRPEIGECFGIEWRWDWP